MEKLNCKGKLVTKKEKKKKIEVLTKQIKPKKQIHRMYGKRVNTKT